MEKTAGEKDGRGRGDLEERMCQGGRGSGKRANVKGQFTYMSFLSIKIKFYQTKRTVTLSA